MLGFFLFLRVRFFVSFLIIVGLELVVFCCFVGGLFDLFLLEFLLLEFLDLELFFWVLGFFEFCISFFRLVKFVFNDVVKLVKVEDSDDCKIFDN